jgi:hypothetical protein
LRVGWLLASLPIALLAPAPLLAALPSPATLPVSGVVAAAIFSAGDCSGIGYDGVSHRSARHRSVSHRSVSHRNVSAAGHVFRDIGAISAQRTHASEYPFERENRIKH